MRPWTRCCSHKKETKKLRELISYSKSSVPNPYKGNQEMRAQKDSDSNPQHFPFQLMCLSTQAWHPSDSLNAIMSSSCFAQLVISPYQNPQNKPYTASKAVSKALLSPYEASPEPAKIRNRAPQFFILVAFSYMAKLNLSPY